MKLFPTCLIFCVVSLSCAQFQDSPEVAAAKAAHFEAVRKTALLIANNPPPVRNPNQKPIEETTQHKLGLNVHDTPEVAAAKAAHYNAVQEAVQATAIANATAKGNEEPVIFSNHQQNIPISQEAPVRKSPSYTTFEIQKPTPVPIVYTSQHKLGTNVRDTPEVSAAKAAHYEAHRRASQIASSSGYNHDGSYIMVPISMYPKLAPIVPQQPMIPVPIAPAVPRFAEEIPQYQRAHQVMYVDYTRMAPIVSIPQTNQHKLGFNVVDTPEVAAAKAAHLEAVRQAQLNAVNAEEELPVVISARSSYYNNPTRQYGQIQY